MIDPSSATAFLSAGRIAVVGASDDPKNFGRTVLQALIDHGIDAVAVHPDASTVAAVPCYPAIDALPGDIEGVIVMVSHDRAAEVVRDAIGRGVERVWLFKGAGRGAVCDEALQLCNDHNVDVIAGACPLMFLEPVRGIHKLHRGLRRVNRSLAKPSAANA
jgi:predicted CoA-binding protein